MYQLLFFIFYLSVYKILFWILGPEADAGRSFPLNFKRLYFSLTRYLQWIIFYMILPIEMYKIICIYERVFFHKQSSFFFSFFFLCNYLKIYVLMLFFTLGTCDTIKQFYFYIFCYTKTIHSITSPFVRKIYSLL